MIERLKKHFTLSNLKGDLFGGITAGIIALPLALAFGEQSGLGAAAGLFAAIVMSFFTSLLCSTQPQISGPTAPMTAVSMVVISQILQANNGEVSKALPAILLVFFLAGILQIILGLIGIGKYIKYVPYPVISGFMTGIGIIIIMGQIFPLMGYDASKDEVMIAKNLPKAEARLISNIVENSYPGDQITRNDIYSLERILDSAKTISPAAIEKEAQRISKNEVKSPKGIIKNIGRGIKNFNWIEFAIVFSTIVVIYGFQKTISLLPKKIPFVREFQKIASSIPTTLIALILVTGVVVLLKLSVKGIAEIPQGFPGLHFDMFSSSTFGAIGPYVMAIFSLALLGSIDSLLTSVIIDNMFKERHNSSQELISQGVGNSMSAMFGGLPGASATIRTLVNVSSGGRTRLSGIFAALLLLSILLALAPLASMIPSAVLAGILITVGIGILDYRGLKSIGKMPIGDVVVMFVVMLLTIFWDLVIAVGIGLVISALIFMKKMGEISADKSRVSTLDAEQDKPWLDEMNISMLHKESIFIKRLEGPLFFGYTNDLQLLSSQVPASSKYVVIRMDKVPYIDQSGLYALEDIVKDLKKKDTEVILIGIQKQPLSLLRRIQLIPNLVPDELNFKTFQDGITWVLADIDSKKETL